MFKAFERTDKVHMSWGELFMPLLSFFVVAAFALVPDLAMANTRAQYDFTLNQDFKDGAETGLQDIWSTVANICLYGGLIASLILYGIGLTQYIRWALGIAVIGGFGDEIVEGIAGAGGLDTYTADAP